MAIGQLSTPRFVGFLYLAHFGVVLSFALIYFFTAERCYDDRFTLATPVHTPMSNISNISPLDEPRDEETTKKEEDHHLYYRHHSVKNGNFLWGDGGSTDSDSDGKQQKASPHQLKQINEQEERAWRQERDSRYWYVNFFEALYFAVVTLDGNGGYIHSYSARRNEELSSYTFHPFCYSLVTAIVWMESYFSIFFFVAVAAVVNKRLKNFSDRLDAEGRTDPANV